MASHRIPPRRWRGEDGLTAVEMVVTSAVLLAVFGIALPIVAGAFNSLWRLDTRFDTNTQAYLALTEVERDARSGNVITAPGSVDGLAGMEVRIYTQTRGTPACVQYRVSSGRLERRTRPPGPQSTFPWPSQWTTVAEGVVNDAQSPVVPAFSRSDDRQLLTIALVLNRSERPGAAVRVTSAVTGRNTKYFDTPFAEEKCD